MLGRVLGGMEDFQLELAQVELVPILKAHRRKQRASGGAYSHIASGLGGQLSGPGYEVVVKVCLQRMGYSHAMVGRNGRVMVDSPHWVDHGAQPRWLGPYDVGFVGQAVDLYRLDEHAFL